MSDQEQQPDPQPIKRLPAWTVVGNLQRREETPWIGTSIEFFDSKSDAERCFERHRLAGDVMTLRPFYHPDESRLHILDTRKQDTTHILESGFALCGFDKRTPNFWPSGHRWVSKSDSSQATCTVCRGLA